MNPSKICWVAKAPGGPGFTWNPVTGCNHGCPFCYARAFAMRKMGRYKQTGFNPTFHSDRLGEPAKVKRPSFVFLGSMAGLFEAENVLWKWYDHESNYRHFHYQGKPILTQHEIYKDILDAIEAAPQHTFVVLTKGPATAKRIIKDVGRPLPPNFILGVSVEDQATADERIPALLSIPGLAKRVVSYEPALGPVDFESIADPVKKYRSAFSFADPSGMGNGPSVPRDAMPGIDWLIIGPQSGRGAVPTNPQWVGDAVTQARWNGVPVWVKDAMPPRKTGMWPQEHLWKGANRG